MTLQKVIPYVFGLMGAMTAVIASAPSAYAFKSAYVQSDSAVIRQSAAGGAAPVATVPKGTRVNTSDNPTSGYYRVRSAKASGWIQESDLSFDMSSAPMPTKAPPPPSSRRRAKKSEAPLDYTWKLEGFGGFDLWTPSDINNLVQSTSLNTGGGFGAELGYRFSRNWMWLFRIEHLEKSVTGTDVTGQTQVALALSSTPVMTGIQYHLGDSGNWSFDGSFLIGLGVGTQLTADQNNAGNPTIYKASTVTELIKFDVDYKMFDSFWAFFEPGYRILKTSEMTPTSVGSTTAFLQNNGAYTPISLALTGIVLNFGARLNF